MHVNLVVLIVILIICFIFGLVGVQIHISVIVSYNRILFVEIVGCVHSTLRLPVSDVLRFIVVFGVKPYALSTSFHKPDLNNRNS